MHIHQLSPNIAVLGYISLLTAMSSAIIYSLLPVFLDESDECECCIGWTNGGNGRDSELINQDPFWSDERLDRGPKASYLVWRI
jgi:hypothetical protein